MLCVVFRFVGPALRSCGSLRSLAAISLNIIVFVVCGLTFVNVSALGNRVCISEAAALRLLGRSTSTGWPWGALGRSRYLTERIWKWPLNFHVNDVS